MFPLILIRVLSWDYRTPDDHPYSGPLVSGGTSQPSVDSAWRCSSWHRELCFCDAANSWRRLARVSWAWQRSCGSFRKWVYPFGVIRTILRVSLLGGHTRVNDLLGSLWLYRTPTHAASISNPRLQGGRFLLSALPLQFLRDVQKPFQHLCILPCMAGRSLNSSL